MAAQSRRRGGVLCHVTSLPGPVAPGRSARVRSEFLDFMAQCGPVGLADVAAESSGLSRLAVPQRIVVRVAYARCSIPTSNCANIRDCSRYAHGALRCARTVRRQSRPIGCRISAAIAWRSHGFTGPTGRVGRRRCACATVMRWRDSTANIAAEIEQLRFDQFAIDRQLCGVARAKRPRAVSCCSATCRCIRRSTAPTSGRIRICSCSMRPNGRVMWLGCRRTIFRRPASSGAIRSTTGIDGRDGFRVVDRPADVPNSAVRRRAHRSFRGLEAYLGRAAQMRRARWPVPGDTRRRARAAAGVPRTVRSVCRWWRRTSASSRRRWTRCATNSRLPGNARAAVCVQRRPGQSASARATTCRTRSRTPGHMTTTPRWGGTTSLDAGHARNVDSLAGTRRDALER